jgi:hypothetical protein
MFISDPNFHPRFRVAKAPDPGPAAKNLSIFYPNNCKGTFSSWKYNPGCLLWIQDPYFSIPDPGSRGQKTPDPGSATLFYTATFVLHQNRCFFICFKYYLHFFPLKNLFCLQFHLTTSCFFYRLFCTFLKFFVNFNLTLLANESSRDFDTF